MSATRISVRDVSKVFSRNPEPALALLRAGESKETILKRTGGVAALDRVSFDVAEGEILVVMGLSGSGKSTMLRCINRLVEPSTGSIVVDGVEVTALSPKELLEFRRKKFGMVFQHFALFPNRTILQNVEYGLEIQRVERRQRAERAMRAIEVVGLKGWESSYPSQLSGGMQQRAGLARALAVDSDILLMDEAFSALDPLIRREMQEELSQLQRNLKKTIVFVSHDLDEAINLGGRIVLMKDGAIVQIGWPEEILLRPADEYVRRFVEHIDISSVLTVERLADRSAPVAAPEDTVAAASARLAGSDIGVLFVVDSGGCLVGRFDAGRGGSAPASLPVARVMETEFARISGNQALKSVLPILVNERDCVPVVGDGGRFIGSLTSHGAVAALARSSGEAAWSGQSPNSRSTTSATKPSLSLPLTARR